MREIKFRAWDERCNKMMYPDKDNPSWVVLKHKEMFDILKLMQFTGLKDKNEKEIYEGDIVKFPSNLNIFVEIEYSNDKKTIPKEIISEVKFEEGAFYFKWMYGYEGKEVSFNQTEVIGNIYENPELLEEEK